MGHTIMPPRKRKDDHNASDSDDDDILLTGGAAFSTAFRTSKRSSRSDPQAQRAKRLKSMKAMVQRALQHGEEKLIEQDRMDEIHQRDSALPSSPLKADRMFSAVAVPRNTETESGYADLDPEIPTSVDGFLPIVLKDSKQTLCLGSRSTLQMTAPTILASTPWPTMNEAMEDLRNVVISSEGIGNDNHDEKQRSRRKNVADSAPSSLSKVLMKHFLRGTTKQYRMKKNTIQELPIEFLQWMFAMACAPTHAVAASIDSPDLLKKSQTGAFQTLCRLLSSGCGYHRGGYMFPLTSLPTQLRQWFGMTLGQDDSSAFLSSGAVNPKEMTLSTIEGSAPPAPETVAPSSAFALRVSQFLLLWSLALQRGIVYCDEIEKEIFKKHASSAIIAVLWAGLDPIFASSTSSGSIPDNGTLHIQAIVSCLLKMVHKVSTMSSPTGGSSTPLDVDLNIEYNKWLERLAQEIFTIWSERLGRGPKGTDAFDDAKAWLSLSRTVRHLALSSLINRPYTDSDNQSRGDTDDLEMALSRCMVCHALGSGAGKRPSVDDWMSTALTQTLNSWESPCRSRSTHPSTYDAWQALALVSVAFSKLGEKFPEDDPSICLSLVEISAVCFHMGLRELHTRILLRCQEDSKGKQQQDDESELIDENGLDAEFNWEKKAMAALLQQMEVSSHNISVFTRRRSMNNICFPRASLMLECIRGFSRLHKAPFEAARASPKQQGKLDSFLSRGGNPPVGTPEN